ncbi:MAG TPA: hypothetical protein VJL33_06095 [Candidatus Bathyarchaeia archaeon]|nr:hypothetical protein [Candidatus Bathyarchaeia archaeon]
MEPALLRKLAEKAITKEQLLKAVESDFGLLPLVIGGVSSSKATIRYGCAKVLVDLSGKLPEKLYPHMDFFISQLDSKYRILVWNAFAAIANLYTADVDKKFDAACDKYYGFLNDEYMVTVANVVGNSATIALAKPYLVPRITAELLHVDEISTSAHLTDECRRVIAEQAIKAFNRFFDKMGVEEKAKVLSFVKKHAKSSRASLRKEAEVFLRRWSL